MKRLIFIFLTTIVTLAAHGQAGVALNEQNMKIEKGLKPVPPKERPALNDDVVIDTATAYFAFLDSAQLHIGREEWRQAEGFLLKAISSDPDNPSNSLVLSNLATIQRNQGRLKEAINNYTLALHLTPNAVTLLHNRASAYLLADSVRRALSDYERIIALDDQDVEALYYHGMITLNMGDSETAKKDFDKIEEIRPSSGLAKQGQGYVHKHKGEFQKAAECFSEVIKVRPSATLLANRADCYLALERLNDASADIADALELDGSDPYIYLLRAKLNKLRFNYDDMNRDIAKAVELGLSEDYAKALIGG